MRFLNPILALSLFLCLCHPSQATTWSQAQQSRDFLAAKKYLSDYLPELAIPKLQALLALSDLEPSARPPLLTLLGQAQVRAALNPTDHPAVQEASQRLSEALATLADPSLIEFSPAHLWRSHALVNLGRIREAITELEKIDRRSMRVAADLQMASLLITIGDDDTAKAKLQPLAKSKKQAVAQEAKIHLIAIALSQNEPDEIEPLLDSLPSRNSLPNGLKNYLKGRLQLLRGQRLEAGGTFQNLLDTPEDAPPITAELYHETTLALADSLALDGNEEAGVTSLLQTLEKHPDSPRLAEIFTRLKAWSPRIETAPLVSKLSTWVPLAEPDAEPRFQAIPESDSAATFSATSNQEILPPRSLYALEFIASTQLKSPDPSVSAKGIKQFEQLQFTGRIDSPLIQRSLLDLGLVYLEKKEHARAITLFQLLSESSPSPLLKAYARALSGKALLAQNQAEEAEASFLEAAKIATRLKETALRNTSELNAGISRLTTSKPQDLDALTPRLAKPEHQSLLTLERGLYLSAMDDPAARDLLASFLANSPKSPRHDEALLALAESSIHAEPADPVLEDFIKAQLPTLTFDSATHEFLEPRRILALLGLGLGLERAADFVTKSPAHPHSPRILFQLGKTQRKVDAIGKAYATFEKFLSAYPDSELIEAARYLSARSSAASGIESGQQNAILRFRELITQNGVLAHEASISLASLLIDREQQEMALLEILKPLNAAALSDSDRRRLLILGADAYGQLGRHRDVLTFYTQLLSIPDLPDSTRNRASFQMGATHEQLDEITEALECYLSVVNRDIDPQRNTSLEWKWYDKCGLEGALTLLEREGRWRAALSLAAKLAKSGSPRASDAAESAERIRRDQRIE